MDAQLRGIDSRLADLAQQRSHADSAAIMGISASGAAIGGISTIVGTPATLEQLAGLSEIDLATVLKLHPELIDQLAASKTPTQVNAWWAALTADQQTALTLGAATLIGRLDGIPPLIRVAANRINATAALARQHDVWSIGRLRGVNLPPLADNPYLRRVANGEIQLYLWAPDKGAIIEMSGDPRTAKSALFVVPGTNTTLDSFTADNPVTAFANWQAQRSPGQSVVTFTVLTGPMPSLDPATFVTNGPQNNTYVAARGAEYAQFVRGINATLPGLPSLSFEHSAGTAVGTQAETVGARFDVHYLAVGVGALDGYQTVPGTHYVATQAPDDINRYYAGIQSPEVKVLWGNLHDVGYGIKPEDFPGIEVVDSKIPGLSPITHGLQGLVHEQVTVHF